MSIHKDREAFIPYCRSDIVELCVRDGKLQGDDVRKFREFCEILNAYQHFDALQHLESLKHNFLPWNPDADTRPLDMPATGELKERENKLLEKFEQVLQKANYLKLTQEEWDKARQQESLIKLRMNVDFGDFERWLCYHRGGGTTTVSVKKLFGKREMTLDTYERVVLLLKFKDEEHFKSKKKKIEDLNFTPGKMYIYFYKKVPQSDLEVLFPNVEVSMNWQEKLQFWVPTLLAGAYTLFKVFGSLVILVAAILFLCGLHSVAQWLGIVLTSKEEALARLAAVTSVLIVLGGFAIKQYIKYKNKRLKFLKDITDTLFFRNLDCNAGVFHRLMDEAEEEECKETILAYYHLLGNKDGLTEAELDDRIEEWLERQGKVKVDFAVHKALLRLQQLQGQDQAAGQTVLTKDSSGRYHVASLDDAKTVIDYVWDNIFNYNK